MGIVMDKITVKYAVTGEPIGQGGPLALFKFFWLIYEAYRRGAEITLALDLIKANEYNRVVDWLLEHYPEEFVRIDG